ncbi:hypothetical protein GAYE_SCF62G6564 [Galdieria yellowstonensis]|uniref:1-phosphatidylinositol 4-kinase n=1 Tax=Galdieria yellowstonensis TaxID=3028027 RepID=A0AAV9IMN5_9RHOD|nr:hypothetical protein GAYE_SCF62G6564 [Galdieria yellowstonensis]
MDPVAFTVRDLDKELPQVSKNIDGDKRRGRSASDLSMGWLLRLFRSDFFDAWMAVTYLYRYRGSRGVHDYLCNELYKLSDEDLELYLPQLCNLLVFHAQDSVALEKFVMDKCAQSMHFALQVYWFLQAACEDCHKERLIRVQQLRTLCETAAVNGYYQSTPLSANPYNEESLVSKELHASSSSHDILQNTTRLRSNSEPEPFHRVGDISSSLLSFHTESSRSLNSSPRVKEKRSHGLHSNTPSETTIQTSPERKWNHSLNNLSRMKPPKMPSCSSNSLLKFQEKKEEESQFMNKNVTSAGDEQTFQQIQELVEDMLNRVERNVTSKEEYQQFDVLEQYFETSLSMNDALVLCRRASGVVNSDETYQEGKEMNNSSHLPNRGTNVTEAVDSINLNRNKSESNNELSPELKAMLVSKQDRFDYFNDGLVFVKQLVRLSSAARDAPSDRRYSFIQRGLNRINELFLRRMAGLESHPSPLKPPPQLPSLEWIAQQGRSAALRSLHLPIARAVSRVLRILRFVPEETVVFATRTKVPFLVFVEVVETNMLCCSQYVFFEHMLMDDYEETNDNDIVAVMESPHFSHRSKRTFSTEETPPSKESRSGSVDSSTTPSSKQKEHVRTAVYGNAESAVDMDAYVESGTEDSNDPESIISRDAALLAVYGEIWHWKAERIRKASPFGHFAGWKLASFIVKAGDDLRQEQLAVQLIAQFRNIFVEEDLALWVRPFTVVCLSADSGLVETLPDAVSLHALKKRTPNFISLLDYFERVYGPKESKRFRTAQRNFAESMAGYSLVCYLLQIKDRHNGNIMLDSQGRVIHIDFGFMLGNSPGSIRFESAPFKLTAEFVEVMGGTQSEAFHYFRELMVQGFLAARKHHEKLTTLVEIMIEGTKIPCMHGGHNVLESFRQRFCLGLLENECIHHMLSLIDESVDNWRTRQYDRYQFYTNGIL